MRAAHAALFICFLSLAGSCPVLIADENAPADFEKLSRDFNGQILELVGDYCLDCHDRETTKGDLDLERFSDFEMVRSDAGVWQQVLEQIDLGEMPPRDKPQPTPAERDALTGWVRAYLRAEAWSQAGDPGPVVLRRLTNDEYNYSVQDLTGVKELNPTREFPVDSAAGEGFTNTGDAQAMSPSLIEKYLSAAREVAGHLVLLPDGIEFSPHTTERDQSNAIVEDIRHFYHQALNTQTIDFSYQPGREVGSVRPTASAEGLVDIRGYIKALLEARDQLASGNPAAAESVAAPRGINARYLHILAEALLKSPTDDVSRASLLGTLGDNILNAEQGLESVDEITQWIQAWQNRLWKFNAVGHLGELRPWQEPVNPVVNSLTISLPLQSGTKDTVDVVLSATGSAENVPVRYSGLRIIRDGVVIGVAGDSIFQMDEGFRAARQTLVSGLPHLLSLCRELLELNEDDRAERAGLLVEKMESPIRGRVFMQLAETLGLLEPGPSVNPADSLDLLTDPIRNAGGHASINGWTRAGLADLSILGNGSDQTWHIPGEVPPHSIVVHPRPERWVGISWKAPDTMKVRVNAFVHDRHGCGNGILWSVSHRTGKGNAHLHQGRARPASSGNVPEIESMTVARGDLISVVIDAADGNHSCDLTQVDLIVSEIGGAAREWSLSRDCADNLSAGNPHPGGHGFPDTWYFHTGQSDGSDEAEDIIPTGSVLAGWLEAPDKAAADQTAGRIQALVNDGPSQDTSPSDRKLVALLTQFGSAFYRGFTHEEFAGWGQSSVTKTTGVPSSGNVEFMAPGFRRISLPAELCAGAELHMTASTSGSGPVQFRYFAGEINSHQPMWDPGAEVVTSTDIQAMRQVEMEFDHFRSLFPLAMCYARVVPIDEVVTLLLYHREDDHLKALMLSSSEIDQLDRLWNKLRYVSRDAFKLEVALEQILEFATQDADPRRFFPMREPVARRAAALRAWLESTEPVHLDSAIHLAGQAWRRPLTTAENHGLRAFYHSLRQEEIPHEQALPLVVARILAAPGFLYRDEAVPTGTDPQNVSSWELATRLSYFLWSSLPDNRLRQLAEDNSLQDPDILGQEVTRMLRDQKVRRLAIQFACQWLHIRDFDTFDEKNERLFPEFSALRNGFYEEAVHFFTDIFQSNESILTILDADHTFANASLAEFYGFKAIAGDPSAFVRIEEIRKSGRGGILGMAATLSKHSGASRTSPVLRGNWIYETILGGKMPRPPAGVPQLPSLTPDGLTERQLIEKHSSDPACVRCHSRIDPFGFALEGFDTIGRARLPLSGDMAPDTKTRLPDGTDIDGLTGLRQYLTVHRRDDFIRTFCTRLLGYALGRSVQLSDEPLLEEMAQQLQAGEFRIGSAIQIIVASPQFQMTRGSAFQSVQQK